MGILSNYCGLGGEGIPKHIIDQICKEHDEDYARLQSQGVNPYWTFNSADREFLNKIRKVTPGDISQSIIKKVANGLFTYKEHATLGRKLRGSEEKVGPSPIDFSKSLKRKPSFSNLPSGEPAKKKMDTRREENTSEATNLVASRNSGRGGVVDNANRNGQETQVSKFRSVARGLPATTTCSLPWINMQYNVETINTIQYDIAYRLNTPYDIPITLIRQDLNTGAGVSLASAPTTDSTVNSAFYWQFWQAAYNHYTVLSTRWVVKIENTGDQPFWVYQIMYGDDYPPVAMNEYMVTWEDTRHQFCVPKAQLLKATGNVAYADGIGAQAPIVAGDGIFGTTESGIVTFKGEWKPGDRRHEVREDAQAQIWTSVAQRPLLQENILFRIKGPNDGYQTSSGFTFGQAMRFNYQVSLEYLVQFKERKAGIKWPTNSQPLILTVDNTVNSTGSTANTEAPV